MRTEPCPTTTSISSGDKTLGDETPATFGFAGTFVNVLLLLFLADSAVPSNKTGTVIRNHFVIFTGSSLDASDLKGILFSLPFLDYFLTARKFTGGVLQKNNHLMTNWL